MNVLLCCKELVEISEVEPLIGAKSRNIPKFTKSSFDTQD